MPNRQTLPENASRISQPLFPICLKIGLSCESLRVVGAGKLLQFRNWNEHSRCDPAKTYPPVCDQIVESPAANRKHLGSFAAAYKKLFVRWQSRGPAWLFTFGYGGRLLVLIDVFVGHKSSEKMDSLLPRCRSVKSRMPSDCELVQSFFAMTP